MRDANALLGDAARLFDDRRNGLRAAARAAAWRGFAGGAEWMRCVLGVVRGTPPCGRAPFERLGVTKYALALGGALVVLVLARPWPVLAASAAIVTFYAVEVRLVFLFPLALDGRTLPFADSHRLLARTLPAGAATARVMRIAATMLFGGFLGHGFLRSWCLGCVAVVLWYEDARRSVAAHA